MAIEFDTSGLRQLAEDLERAGVRIGAAVKPVIAKGAVNIKKQLRDEMSASASFGELATGIGYDLTDTAGVIEAQIGPTKRHGSGRGIGKGANIAYFGTSKGGGTVPDPRGALEAEGPNFEKALGDVLGDLL